MTKRIDPTTWVTRCIAARGDDFDYSRVVYTVSTAKIEIGCRRCGCWFWQQANAHWTLKQGCSKCKSINARARYVFSQEEFEKRVRRHGRKLDLSKAVYIHCETPVDVRCEICDLWFKPHPTSLMRGSGCPSCACVLKMTHDNFLKRAYQVHGDRYEYLTQYVRSVKHICIKCKKCGHVFEQPPNSHINNKNGCPRCVHKISEAEIAWLDKLNIPKENRQSSIPEFRNNRFKVDALVDRTVYEFYGTYYHGDPRKYTRDVINEKCGLTMGELYDMTISRYERLENLGYTVRFVWELDYDAGLRFSTKHPSYKSE
jgi:Zn finger protein HypA/HybF involved in hydrogenase expression